MMIRAWLGFGVAIAALALFWSRPEVRALADDANGAVVDFDGLKSAAPTAWKEEEPASKMRYKQFRLSHSKGDKADAELLIFRGFGGSAKENIKRWKEQFQPPEGKKLEDVAKVTDTKVAGHEVTYLDITGVYLFKERPFDPNAKVEKRPDYRMLAVHFEGPKNIYHIKLVGPEKTIEEYKKGFDDWLKAFK
jgi:hypothetical protein